MSKRSPNALRAFCLMKNFYFTKRITKDCIAMTLTIILMFSKHKLKSTRLAPLAMLLIMSLDCLNSLFEKQYFASLFECLSQCITLSYCEKKIASLLCNAIFKSNVSCNLIEIYLFKIQKVLKLIAYNSSTFVRLIIARNLIIFAL
jgi:hypothetical protein